MPPKRKQPSDSSGSRDQSAIKRVKHVEDLTIFTEELQESVNRMLPTGGRRYQTAAILAIDFSVCDIPGVKPLRNELLGILENVYHWEVEKYTIDCTSRWTQALKKQEEYARNFEEKYLQRTSGKVLLVYYFSGHGFMDRNGSLNICGSFSRGRGRTPTPNTPWLPWNDSRIIPLNDEPNRCHQLVIMDCCAAGLANLRDRNVEVLGASAWESTASAAPQSSFTRALIKELKALNGSSITTTQLISQLYSQRSVRDGVSQPVLKRATSRLEPALIHCIVDSPAPLPQVTKVPRYAHVLIAVKVKKENTVPDAKGWAEWLKTNMPNYLGEIEIQARWKTESALVVFVLPLEIWLGLQYDDAYIFMDFHDGWDSGACRQRQLALLAPRGDRQIRAPAPALPQGGGLGERRSGNIPRPGDPGPSQRK